MGADGGVVYIPLKHPSAERYDRVVELLQPFWQFLNRDGGADWAEEANWKWEQENSIGPPTYVLGYYGTDRGDSFDLGDLRELCLIDYRRSYDDDGLYSLTLDELDLDCRTSPFPITGSHNHHPLHRLWYSHFHYYPREEVVKQLGPIASTTVEAWAKELTGLLNLPCTVQEETWT